jgi:hypothetical protein
MWIPKTEDELKELTKQKEKTALIGGSSMALVFIFIEIIDARYFGVKIEKFPIPLSQPIYTWSQILKSLPRLSMFASIFWILGYLGMRKLRIITTLICIKCKKIKGYDKVKDCDCGGHFVFLDEMNWIEDKELLNNEEETGSNT